MSDEWQTKLRRTTSELDELWAKYPDDHIIASAIEQLQYLLALAEGTECDDSSLEAIDIGYLSMYPLAGIISNDLSVALCEIADKIRVDLRRQGRQRNIDHKK